LSRISLEEFREITRGSLPFAMAMGVEAVEIERGRARFRLPYRADFLRPGGTIGGPLLMGLADVAMYAVVLSAVGRQELAVTSSLTMNFLRKPGPAAVIAEGRLLRLGRRLAFGEVELFTEGDPEMVAHATVTYALPSKSVVS
jgi:uncharacterized protein (TIGR00369 family)